MDAAAVASGIQLDFQCFLDPGESLLVGIFEFFAEGAYLGELLHGHYRGSTTLTRVAALSRGGGCNILSRSSCALFRAMPFRPVLLGYFGNELSQWVFFETVLVDLLGLR